MTESFQACWCPKVPTSKALDSGESLLVVALCRASPSSDSFDGDHLTSVEMPLHPRSFANTCA